MKRSWRDDEDVGYHVASSAFTTITDSIIDTHSAVKVLAITVTAEIFAFVMLYFAKDKVLDSLDESGSEVWIYAAIGTFVAGFLTVFASFPLLPTRYRKRIPKYAIWFVSVVAGLANIALFFVLLTFKIG